MDAEELIYARGELPVESLRQEIARFWDDVAASPDLQAELAEAGLEYEVSDREALARQITVRIDSSGADPTSVLLIVSLAPTANRVLKDVWATMILPRIRRRWGDDAIGGEKPGHKE